MVKIFKDTRFSAWMSVWVHCEATVLVELKNFSFCGFEMSAKTGRFSDTTEFHNNGKLTVTTLDRSVV
ncbi:MAG TPA: hypothetical protein VFW11_18660 [Cyclobacteriaceae bacterium]|nr:hypothetical protein [Cyclobacteriaceae bacterium]